MKLKTCLTLKLKWFLYFNFELSTFFYPSKPKDLTNPFGKSYPQTLRAGLELHSIQIVCRGLGRGPAEYCQQAGRKQAEK
jgi:hypothetical protein